MNNDSAIGIHQVRSLYARFGSPARDLAARLLGEDPFQADRVTRKAFLALVGESTHLLAREKTLNKRIANEVVRLCLVQTGNGAVADWAEYQAKHPEPKRKRSAAAAQHTDPIRPLRPQKAVSTRKARQQLLEAPQPVVTVVSSRREAEQEPTPR
jgi:hypothetical protein